MVLSITEYYTIKMHHFFFFFLFMLKGYTNSFPVKWMLKCSIKKHSYHNSVDSVDHIRALLNLFSSRVFFLCQSAPESIYFVGRALTHIYDCHRIKELYLRQGKGWRQSNSHTFHNVMCSLQVITVILCNQRYQVNWKTAF